MSLRRSPWWALPLGLGALGVGLDLAPGRIFFVSDLSFYYWPLHQWFRQSVAAFEIPLWDPYVGLGQPAIIEPTRHLFFPPALLSRLLLPDVAGFNLFVALPVPVLAVGMYAYLRDLAPARAAAVAAAATALSGPALSIVAYPNLAWSVALMAWALALAEPALRLGRLVPLALVLGLQALAGEPLSVAMTLALLVLQVSSLRPARLRADAGLRLLLATTLGLALGAVQLLPAAAAAGRSTRALGGVPDLLSLHPASLIEALVSPVFSDPAGSWRVVEPWLPALNDGHDPLYASRYIGIPLLALAVAGAAGGALRERLWALVALAGVLLALGRYTPVLPALQGVLPVLASLRYPSKYLIVAMLACGVLACAALAWLLDSRELEPRRRFALAAGALAAAGAVLATGGVLASGAAVTAFDALARAAAVPEPAAAAARAAAALQGQAGSVIAFGGATAAVLALAAARGRGSGAMGGALAAALLGDLLAHAPQVNPTVDAGLLRQPEWVDSTRQHPEDRVYVGGRMSFITGRRDPDDVPRAGAPFPAGASRRVVTAIYQSTFATAPSVWRLRDAVSIDLAAVWPALIHGAYERFARAGPEERARFLTRSGVRYYLTPHPPSPDSRRVLSLTAFPAVALYERPPRLARASLVPRHRVVGSQPAALEALFDDGIDTADVVTLEASPPRAVGVPGVAAPSGVVWLMDATDRLSLRASVPADGAWLVVRDSWDPDWVARVDGKRVALTRADGLFRAVRLSPGVHDVELRYAPAGLRAGVALTSLAALALLALAGGLFGPARLPMLARVFEAR